MKSNYNKIGQYIRLIDERNFDLKVETLLGLTINKDFIPSVANTVGSDMSRYKIIRKNQFACSLMQVRRDKKIPVALQRNYKEAIISQAYPVFDVTNKDELLPEYLMMWFSRSEFDREACFYAVGGVRGSLEWEDFCNMQLPVPDIEKQKAIVKEYNTIVNRIKLNEQLNQKLEETAQAIYKQWFVDEYGDLDSVRKSELDEFIELQELQGADNLDFFLVEWYGRFANPFSTFILTLIGLTLSARKVKGGIGMQIGLGLFLSFSYIFFMQFSQQFAISGSLNPAIAVWIPNMLYLIIGMVLYCYAPK